VGERTCNLCRQPIAAGESVYEHGSTVVHPRCVAAEDRAADREADERYRARASSTLPHHRIDVCAGDVLRWLEGGDRLRGLVNAVRAHVGPTPACLAFPANTAGLTCRTVHPIHAEAPCALCTLVTELEACEREVGA
jgi:hypothetical protein